MPSATTSTASSYTAPSTQPPDTDPLTVPSGATTIDAPGGRGAERKVRTTVATPAVPPSRQTASRSANTSLTPTTLLGGCSARGLGHLARAARLQRADQAGRIPRT